MMKIRFNPIMKILIFIILFVALSKLGSALHSKIFSNFPLWFRIIILIPILVIIFRWNPTKIKYR